MSDNNLKDFHERLADAGIFILNETEVAKNTGSGDPKRPPKTPRGVSHYPHIPGTGSQAGQDSHAQGAPGFGIGARPLAALFGAIQDALDFGEGVGLNLNETLGLSENIKIPTFTELTSDGDQGQGSSQAKRAFKEIFGYEIKGYGAQRTSEEEELEANIVRSLRGARGEGENPGPSDINPVDVFDEIEAHFHKIGDEVSAKRVADKRQAFMNARREAGEAKAEAAGRAPLTPEQQAQREQQAREEAAERSAEARDRAQRATTEPPAGEPPSGGDEPPTGDEPPKSVEEQVSAQAAIERARREAAGLGTPEQRAAEASYEENLRQLRETKAVVQARFDKAKADAQSAAARAERYDAQVAELEAGLEGDSAYVSPEVMDAISNRDAAEERFKLAQKAVAAERKNLDRVSAAISEAEQTTPEAAPNIPETFRPLPIPDELTPKQLEAAKEKARAEAGLPSDAPIELTDDQMISALEAAHAEATTRARDERARQARQEALGEDAPPIGPAGGVPGKQVEARRFAEARVKEKEKQLKEEEAQIRSAEKYEEDRQQFKEDNDVKAGRKTPKEVAEARKQRKAVVNASRRDREAKRAKELQDLAAKAYRGYLQLNLPEGVEPVEQPPLTPEERAQQAAERKKTEADMRRASEDDIRLMDPMQVGFHRAATQQEKDRAEARLEAENRGSSSSRVEAANRTESVASAIGDALRRFGSRLTPGMRARYERKQQEAALAARKAKIREVLALDSPNLTDAQKAKLRKEEAELKRIQPIDAVGETASLIESIDGSIDRALLKPPSIMAQYSVLFNGGMDIGLPDIENIGAQAAKFRGSDKTLLANLKLEIEKAVLSNGLVKPRGRSTVEETWAKLKDSDEERDKRLVKKALRNAISTIGIDKFNNFVQPGLSDDKVAELARSLVLLNNEMLEVNITNPKVYRIAENFLDLTEEEKAKTAEINGHTVNLMDIREEKEVFDSHRQILGALRGIGKARKQKDVAYDLYRAYTIGMTDPDLPNGAKDELDRFVRGYTNEAGEKVTGALDKLFEDRTEEGVNAREVAETIFAEGLMFASELRAMRSLAHLQGRLTSKENSFLAPNVNGSVVNFPDSEAETVRSLVNDATTVNVPAVREDVVGNGADRDQNENAFRLRISVKDSPVSSEILTDVELRDILIEAGADEHSISGALKLRSEQEDAGLPSKSTLGEDGSIELGYDVVVYNIDDMSKLLEGLQSNAKITGVGVNNTDDTAEYRLTWTDVQANQAALNKAVEYLKSEGISGVSLKASKMLNPARRTDTSSTNATLLSVRVDLRDGSPENVAKVEALLADYKLGRRKLGEPTKSTNLIETPTTVITIGIPKDINADNFPSVLQAAGLTDADYVEVFGSEGESENSVRLTDYSGMSEDKLEQVLDVIGRQLTEEILFGVNDDYLWVNPHSDKANVSFSLEAKSLLDNISSQISSGSMRTTEMRTFSESLLPDLEEKLRREKDALSGTPGAGLEIDKLAKTAKALREYLASKIKSQENPEEFVRDIIDNPERFDDENLDTESGGKINDAVSESADRTSRALLSDGTLQRILENPELWRSQKGKRATGPRREIEDLADFYVAQALSAAGVSYDPKSSADRKLFNIQKLAWLRLATLGALDKVDSINDAINDLSSISRSKEQIQNQEESAPTTLGRNMFNELSIEGIAEMISGAGERKKAALESGDTTEADRMDRLQRGLKNLLTAKSGGLVDKQRVEGARRYADRHTPGEVPISSTIKGILDDPFDEVYAENGLPTDVAERISRGTWLPGDDAKIMNVASKLARVAPVDSDLDIALKLKDEIITRYIPEVDENGKPTGKYSERKFQIKGIEQDSGKDRVVTVVDESQPEYLLDRESMKEWDLLNEQIESLDNSLAVKQREVTGLKDAIEKLRSDPEVDVKQLASLVAKEAELRTELRSATTEALAERALILRERNSLSRNYRLTDDGEKMVNKKHRNRINLAITEQAALIDPRALGSFKDEDFRPIVDEAEKYHFFTAVEAEKDKTEILRESNTLQFPEESSRLGQKLKLADGRTVVIDDDRLATQKKIRLEDVETGESRIERATGALAEEVNVARPVVRSLENYLDRRMSDKQVRAAGRRYLQFERLSRLSADDIAALPERFAQAEEESANAAAAAAADPRKLLPTNDAVRAEYGHAASVHQPPKDPNAPTLGVGIVGSREMDRVLGEALADMIVTGNAEANPSVVSGGAGGADTYGEEAALRRGDGLLSWRTVDSGTKGWPVVDDALHGAMVARLQQLASEGNADAKKKLGFDGAAKGASLQFRNTLQVNSSDVMWAFPQTNFDLKSGGGGTGNTARKAITGNNPKWEDALSPIKPDAKKPLVAMPLNSTGDKIDRVELYNFDLLDEKTQRAQKAILAGMLASHPEMFEERAADDIRAVASAIEPHVAPDMPPPTVREGSVVPSNGRLPEASPSKALARRASAPGFLTTKNYMETNSDTGERVVIDAAHPSSGMADSAEGKAKDVLLTHAHFDHIAGLPALAAQLYGREKLNVYVHESEAEALRNSEFFSDETMNLVPFKGDDIITAGGMEFKAYHVPGHSPGSVTFLKTTDEGQRLYAGDALKEDGLPYGIGDGKTSSSDDRGVEAMPYDEARYKQALNSMLSQFKQEGVENPIVLDGHSKNTAYKMSALEQNSALQALIDSQPAVDTPPTTQPTPASGTPNRAVQTGILTGDEADDKEQQMSLFEQEAAKVADELAAAAESGNWTLFDTIQESASNQCFTEPPEQDES